MRYDPGRSRWRALLERFDHVRRTDGFATACRRALAFLGGRALTHVGRVRPREVTVSHPRATFRMLGSWTRTAGIGKDYPDTGCHEYPVTSVFVEILDSLDRPVVFDVGAANGYYSLLACQHTPAANVHAFDGDRVNAAYFRMNNRRYAAGEMHLVESFVGARRLRLDAYAECVARPDVLKVDVDGGEADVIESMTGLLEAGHYPYVLLEVHCWGEYGSRLATIRDVLAGAAYRAYVCVDHRDLGSEFTEVSLAELTGDPADGCRDYMVVLCPDDGDVRPDELSVSPAASRLGVEDCADAATTTD